MKKQMSIALIALIFLVINSNAQQNEAKDDIKWIEKAIDVIVEDNNVPSVVVGIVRNGKVEKFISRGLLNRNGNTEVDENTLFQIGSLTKSFTGIITNNLVVEGKLDVDASIIKYLPDTLSPATKTKLAPIKVRDILHHRSGIPRDTKVYHRFGNDPMLCCYTEKDLLDDLEVLELDFQPDSKSEYSNFAYGVLGYIFERASGKTYEELLQTYVSKELDLVNTTTVPNESQKKLVATPYRKENRNYETLPFDMGKLVSAGGIYSTISDLSKLLSDQMADYRVFLADKKTSPLILTQNTKPFNQRLSYGYGLFATKEGGFGHGGDVDGFASGYTFFPDKNLGLIFLTSSGGNWVRDFENIITKRLTGKPVEMPTVRNTISVRREKLHKYTGKYLLSGKDILNIVQNGNRIEAYLQGTFSPRELYFESVNKVFAKTINVEFEFGTDKIGNFTILKGTFNGQLLDIEKIE